MWRSSHDLFSSRERCFRIFFETKCEEEPSMEKVVKYSNIVDRKSDRHDRSSSVFGTALGVQMKMRKS